MPMFSSIFPNGMVRAGHFEARALVRALVLAAVLPWGATSALATPFSITGTITTAQTLGSSAGQTGSVSATGSLVVSGSVVAVTISGNNATVTNLGTISQTGTGRVIRDNTGVSGLTITNGSVTNTSAVMKAADGDVVQMNKSAASVTLNNYGQMISANASAGGAQVVDFTAIQSGQQCGEQLRHRPHASIGGRCGAPRCQWCREQPGHHPGHHQHWQQQ